MTEKPQTYFERFNPDYVSGLTDQQAAQRVRQGLVNGSDQIKTKSIPLIIRDNLITFFNILNVILAALVLSVGSYKNLLFMGVIICNTLIGIIQEIKAKKTIDNLSLITAPKAHVVRSGTESNIAVSDIVLDDVILLSTGNQIPADCIVLDGQCEADESLLTGESDPVFKNCGDSLLSGGFIVSGKCRAKVEHVGQENYASKIAASAKYLKKPNSEIMKWINLIIKFIGFSIIPIGAMLFYKQIFVSGQNYKSAIVSTVAALIGMIPEGLVLLTSVVLAVGVIRLSRHKALVQELYSIETLARVDTLCLDKTGTITEGSMQVDSVIPLSNKMDKKQIEDALAAIAASLNDGTPTMNAVKDAFPHPPKWKCDKEVPFSSARKWSGAGFGDSGAYVLGAGEFILRERFDEIRPEAEKYAKLGQRVLLLADVKNISADGIDPSDATPVALVLLSDKIRKNARKTLEYFDDQGVTLKVISGDNPATVSYIAKKAGLNHAERYIDASTLKSYGEIQAAVEKYTVFGRVTPKQKLELVKALKEKKHTVAMTGDGVNDVPALKESDCSIAMASGSDAARTVSNVVLLDSDFASMPRIVNEGRRSINNLQRSASLFLVKAIFSALIAVMFIFLTCNYPFQPIQFTLINAVSIGIPSFFLALEPNRDRIHGKFIVNVMEKSLPGALTLTINIAVLAAICLFFSFSDKEISTLAVIITGYTELLVLFKVCYPFTINHKILFVLMLAGFVLALIFFPALFEVTPITLPMLFISLPLILLATCLMPVLSHLFDKIIFKKLKL
ncbi:MAG TPA: cation-translocating P-type ATPase [Caproicibacter sp.]|nr:cation-translocating P-type ATPase [Caproicibacter sp.]